jgi:hypothetical protein
VVCVDVRRCHVLQRARLAADCPSDLGGERRTSTRPILRRNELYGVEAVLVDAYQSNAERCATVA